MAYILLASLLSWSMLGIATAHDSIPKANSGHLLRREIDSCQHDPENCLSGQRVHFGSDQNITGVNEWLNGTNTTQYASTGLRFTRSRTGSAQHHEKTTSPRSTNSSLSWIYGTAMSSASSQSSISGIPTPSTLPQGTRPQGTGPALPLYTASTHVGPSGLNSSLYSGFVGERVKPVQSSGYIRGK